MNQDRQQQVQNIVPNNYNTIMLIGRSEDDKSPLTNHLGGENEGDHPASLAELYISEKCNLNIIDTKGPDRLRKDKENQALMKEVCQKTISYIENALAAIIIVWCPLQNSNSGFQKTLNALQESFGKDVTKSCIFIIQGHWRPFTEGQTVLNEIEEIKKLFPDIPVIEYDAKGSLDGQLPFLQATIEKVKPYEKRAFRQRQNYQITLAESFWITLFGFIICVIAIHFQSQFLAVIGRLLFLPGLSCLVVNLVIKIWKNRGKSLENISLMLCFFFVLARFLYQDAKTWAKTNLNRR